MTAPRPAHSLSPPIASPRPGGASVPGHRPRSTPRPAVAGLIIMLLLVTLIPTASAETIEGQIHDVGLQSEDIPAIDTGAGGDVQFSSWKIEYNPVIGLKPASMHFLDIQLSPLSQTAYAAYPNYHTYDLRLERHGTSIKVADVTVEFFKGDFVPSESDPSKGKTYGSMRLTFNNWDYAYLNTLTQKTSFYFSDVPSEYWDFQIIRNVGAAIPPDAPVLFYQIFAPYKNTQPASRVGHHVYYYELEYFTNNYTISTDEHGTDIYITRIFGDDINPSKIIVSKSDGTELYKSPDYETANRGYAFPYGDLIIDIEGIYGVKYRILGDTIIPTEPGDPAGPFSLTLSPASVQVGETVTATLLAAAAAPHYSYIVWSCTPDDHPDMATWSYRIQDVNGTWYERAANGDEIPISAADALTYQATPAYPGGHHIGVTIYDHHPPCQGLEQRATLAKPFEALYKSGSSPVRIQVVDERTGGLIAGSHIQVIDSQLPPFEGTGINPIIDTTLPQGSEMFYLQRNAYDEPRYRIFADADGYRQVTENQWFSVNPSSPNTVTIVKVQMAAAAAPPEDPNNAFVTFRIRDEDGNPVKEARVTLDRWTRHALGTRPVTFEVPRGTYQYTVEPIDAGLYPATGSVTVGEEDSYEVNVVLSRTPGDDPGATPPPRDTRTNEEKGKAVIDLLADNAELIATLAILAAVMGLINLIMPGRRRR